MNSVFRFHLTDNEGIKRYLTGAPAELSKDESTLLAPHYQHRNLCWNILRNILQALYHRFIRAVVRRLSNIDKMRLNVLFMHPAYSCSDIM
ncbi:hypothetical protein M378DRAFT_171308 [Amanita muscaria Koide BX008]|uniref:Uncharacterized protein n=1 Tax=Amanita muscaria (strain Koide BX008) TaxID=946122 RepID=A0A0C2WNH4_AMAMK|nr:hypothetical protein M378DRAFT_171308 [Amanita muscaria Koide BX008]